MTRLNLRGVDIYSQLLAPDAQLELLKQLRSVARAAPFAAPLTPQGKPMSVRMTSAGRYGWASGPGGYHYAKTHPDGTGWPPIPPAALALWHMVTGVEREPECCLINYYGEGARMGLHQDKDEADFQWPVVSISLGDDGLFRVGSVARGGPTASHWLASGDVAVMGGDARLVHHGVDKIRFGSSSLLPKGGRINVTLRVVE